MKNQEVLSGTLDHLWTSANVVLNRSRPISGHLARTLVRSVSNDGMSSFTRRLHCENCGFLHNLSRVRVRKVKKKGCGKNQIVRKCMGCGKTEVERGTIQKPPKRKVPKAEKLVQSKQSNKKRRRDSVGSQYSTDKTSGTKKKKNKRRRDSGVERSTGGNGNDSLATSFLFQPIP